MSRDGERLIETVNELGTRVGHLLSDMVPPAAQVHLLNAQRELITALMLIYEHRVTARRAAGAAPGGGSSPRTGQAAAVQARRQNPDRVRTPKPHEVRGFAVTSRGPLGQSLRREFAGTPR